MYEILDLYSKTQVLTATYTRFFRFSDFQISRFSDFRIFGFSNFRTDIRTDVRTPKKMTNHFFRAPYKRPEILADRIPIRKIPGTFVRRSQKVVGHFLESGLGFERGLGFDKGTWIRKWSWLRKGTWIRKGT